MNRFRWPTDKSLESANSALSAWLGTPIPALNPAKAHWWPVNPRTRAFAKRVCAWMDPRVPLAAAPKPSSSN